MPKNAQVFQTNRQLNTTKTGSGPKKKIIITDIINKPLHGQADSQQQTGAATGKANYTDVKFKLHEGNDSACLKAKLESLYGFIETDSEPVRKPFINKKRKIGKKLSEHNLYKEAKNFFIEKNIQTTPISSDIGQVHDEAGFIGKSKQENEYHVFVHPALDYGKQSSTGMLKATSFFGTQNDSPSLAHMNKKVLEHLDKNTIASDKCHFHYLISQHRKGISGNHFVYGYCHGLNKTLHIVDSKHTGLYRPQKMKKDLGISRIKVVTTREQSVFDDWSCGWQSFKACVYSYESLENRDDAYINDDYK